MYYFKLNFNNFFSPRPNKGDSIGLGATPQYVPYLTKCQITEAKDDLDSKNTN